jgi:hypothetical protein
MINNTHLWWWHSKIKRIAKFAKWDNLGFVSKSLFGLSIVFDLR